jgi:hypothetical protein
LAAVTAFGLGAAATVVAKLILAAVLVEPQAGADFLARLDLYLEVPVYNSWVGQYAASLPRILLPFARLVRQSNMLTYGSRVAGYSLLAVTGLAWLAAVIRGWRGRYSEHGQDMLILAGAALLPVAWVLILPKHAWVHAPFIVRMLVVPISLAPLALCWPSPRGSAGRPNTC